MKLHEMPPSMYFRHHSFFFFIFFLCVCIVVNCFYGQVDENELKAKYDEDRQRWEEEKKDLTEQLNVAKSKLTEKERVYSMFGNFNWD